VHGGRLRVHLGAAVVDPGVRAVAEDRVDDAVLLRMQSNAKTLADLVREVRLAVVAEPAAEILVGNLAAFGAPVAGIAGGGLYVLQQPAGVLVDLRVRRGGEEGDQGTAEDHREQFIPCAGPPLSECRPRPRSRECRLWRARAGRRSSL